MAVVQGNAALASDYNTLRTEVNKWFRDPNPSMTFGDGDQTYGWGGDAVSAVSQGQLMTALSMNGLIDRVNIGEDICNVVSGQLSQIVAGNAMTAAEFNAIETKSDLITTYRLNIEAAELSISGGGSSVRSTNWGAGLRIYARFGWTFSDFAHARYFFNSGGALTMSGNITGYSTGTGWDGAGINGILNAAGTITMNYTTTTQSGSGGTPQSIGYYDLTTSWQSIFKQNGTGAYSDADLEIWAIRDAAGSFFEFWYELTPGPSRDVDGTTTATAQQRKLINQSSGAVSLAITAPTYSLVQGF